MQIDNALGLLFYAHLYLLFSLNILSVRVRAGGSIDSNDSDEELFNEGWFTETWIR